MGDRRLPSDQCKRKDVAMVRGEVEPLDRISADEWAKLVLEWSMSYRPMTPEERAEESMVHECVEVGGQDGDG